MRCRPYSTAYSGHPIAAHIGLDDPPSSTAGWWPNIVNLNSTTCARTTLRMGKVLHIYLPEWFSIAGHFGAVCDARGWSEQRIHQPHKKADDHRMGTAPPRPRVGSFVPVGSHRGELCMEQRKRTRFRVLFQAFCPGRSKRIKLTTCSRSRRTAWPSGMRQTPGRADRCREARGCWVQVRRGSSR